MRYTYLAREAGTLQHRRGSVEIRRDAGPAQPHYASLDAEAQDLHLCCTLGLLLVVIIRYNKLDTEAQIRQKALGTSVGSFRPLLGARPVEAPKVVWVQRRYYKWLLVLVSIVVPFFGLTNYIKDPIR